jgi:hypothetical protein
MTSTQRAGLSRRAKTLRALPAAALATATGTATTLLLAGTAWAAGTTVTTGTAGATGGNGLPGTSGNGTAPPGVSTNVDTIISWACWICFTIAILGVLFVAFKMIVQHHRGEGGQQFASLAYVLGGAILVAAASGIIGALTTAA